MLGFLAQPFSLLLELLYNLLGRYGLAIIALSLVVRLAMYPIYKKQISSTAGMADMSQKSREIQQKYANDRETMNQKMAELYKETGYNPMSGCLPMIVQMVVIIGLFSLLRYPLNYLSSENMIFAVHEPFLWIKDLSQPDLWILPILCGVATFFATSMSQQNNIGQNAGGAMGMGMMNIFPVMILWLARTYPAGLAIYWFISQFTQIFFNLRFNQLRKKMASEKGAKKTKKKKAPFEA